ncbi:hypothetical protein TNCV_4702401 [Trichonephila clavipes]|nr:hypothetical protein TNCV_4702401 [Trichonephila clavipes]
MKKTYFQCHRDRALYSPPDGELDTVSKLDADTPTYCLEAPRTKVEKSRNKTDRTDKFYFDRVSQDND